MYLYTYIYICCRFKRKTETEAQAIFLNPFTVFSSCKRKRTKRICPSFGHWRVMVGKTDHVMLLVPGPDERGRGFVKILDFKVNCVLGKETRSLHSRLRWICTSSVCVFYTGAQFHFTYSIWWRQTMNMCPKYYLTLHIQQNAYSVKVHTVISLHVPWKGEQFHSHIQRMRLN